MKPTLIKSNYAIGCELDEQVFFVTFNTRDEREAIDLSKCVVGKMAEKCLLIINEKGDIFEL